MIWKFFHRSNLLGLNACYFENLDNVPKWKGPRDETTKQVVINTEWGALGKVNISLNE
jgi:hexokinase